MFVQCLFCRKISYDPSSKHSQLYRSCKYLVDKYIIFIYYVHIIYYLIDFEIISYMYFIIFVVGMNMDIVISESSPEKLVSTWMSFVILRISSEAAKLKFREVEKVALKICFLNSHLSFNETCLNNKLLPTFTCIIYIYIYIYL